MDNLIPHNVEYKKERKRRVKTSTFAFDIETLPNRIVISNTKGGGSLFIKKIEDLVELYNILKNETFNK